MRGVVDLVELLVRNNVAVEGECGKKGRREKGEQVGEFGRGEVGGEVGILGEGGVQRGELARW